MTKVVVEGGKLAFLIGMAERTFTPRATRCLRSTLLRSTPSVPEPHFQAPSAPEWATVLVQASRQRSSPSGADSPPRMVTCSIAFRNPDRCKTVSLKDEPYKRVIVQVGDKESVADEIRRAISTFTRSA